MLKNGFTRDVVRANSTIEDSTFPCSQSINAENIVIVKGGILYYFETYTRRSYYRPTPRSAACAAKKPQMPWTPPPGGVEAEQRYTPRSGVR